MAAKPAGAGTAKPAGTGVGIGGVVVVLLLIALALGAGHRHLAAPASGGGNAQVVPHLVGTPADPCQHRPDDHVVRTIRATGRSRTGVVLVDCTAWREIVRRIVDRGTARATIRQILACLSAAVYRGAYRELRTADAWRWQWGPGQDETMVVIADLAGRVSLAEPGPNPLSWRRCAAVARR